MAALKNELIKQYALLKPFLEQKVGPAHVAECTLRATVGRSSKLFKVIADHKHSSCSTLAAELTDAYFKNLYHEFKEIDDIIHNPDPVEVMLLYSKSVNNIDLMVRSLTNIFGQEPAPCKALATNFTNFVVNLSKVLPITDLLNDRNGSLCNVIKHFQPTLQTYNDSISGDLMIISNCNRFSGMGLPLPKAIRNGLLDNMIDKVGTLCLFGPSRLAGVMRYRVLQQSGRKKVVSKSENVKKAEAVGLNSKKFLDKAIAIVGDEDLIIANRKKAFRALVNVLYAGEIELLEKSKKLIFVDVKTQKKYRSCPEAIKGGVLDKLLLETGVIALKSSVFDVAYARYKKITKNKPALPEEAKPEEQTKELPKVKAEPEGINNDEVKREFDEGSKLGGACAQLRTPDLRRSGEIGNGAISRHTKYSPLKDRFPSASHSSVHHTNQTQSKQQRDKKTSECRRRSVNTDKENATTPQKQPHSQGAIKDVTNSVCLDKSKEPEMEKASCKDDAESSESAPLTGRWTNLEHSRFLKGLNVFGERYVQNAKFNWREMAQFIQTRDPVQVRTHAQKYFIKLNKQKERKRKRGEYNDYENQRTTLESQISDLLLRINHRPLKRDRVEDTDDACLTIADIQSAQQMLLLQNQNFGNQYAIV